MADVEARGREGGDDPLPLTSTKTSSALVSFVNANSVRTAENTVEQFRMHFECGWTCTDTRCWNGGELVEGEGAGVEEEIDCGADAGAAEEDNPI